MVSQCLNLVSKGPFSDVMHEEKAVGLSIVPIDPSSCIPKVKRLPQPAILAGSLSNFFMLKYQALVQSIE